MELYGTWKHIKKIDMKQYKLANTLRLTIGDKKANEYFIKLITKILK